ncbi:MAG: ATP-binding protein [Clostridia bacterium]|nr:ATP-binding protein [Clostridia bacterium]MBQ8196779.1 ATP-binding protein [Clostridia bacterium]
MKKEEQKNLAKKLLTLSVFRNLINEVPLKNLINYLKSEVDVIEKASLYGEFVYSLGVYGNSFSEFLSRAIFEDENYYIVSVAKKKKIDSSIMENAIEELKLLSSLTELDEKELTQDVIFEYVPKFKNKRIDFVFEYKKRIKNVDKYGYGIFASSEMFKVVDGEIIPVESADEIKLDSFVGYEDERNQVLENTKALLEGRPAANVLLCGDAGTGKSSTVKACVNHFYKDGLRLIEIRKDQLLSLASVMGKIADNPLKFIIFIDDLSFNKNDDSFSMLKAALEGSASKKANNAVIYATSNRKHIIKESFADRNSTDDVHRNDTMQELLSLSDRFGLTVYFQKPNKELYLNIVKILAQKSGINVSEDLLVKAEAFALSKGSRSPRAAEQFINSLL